MKEQHWLITLKRGQQATKHAHTHTHKHLIALLLSFQHSVAVFMQWYDQVYKKWLVVVDLKFHTMTPNNRSAFHMEVPCLFIVNYYSDKLKTHILHNTFIVPSLNLYNYVA